VSVQIQLPPGNSGFNMQDGTEYKGRAGGHVTVADEHAAAIRRQVGGDAGLTGHGSFRTFGGTRNGRWCPQPGCNFLANSWSAECPRCARNGVVTLTIPESEMPEQPRSQWPSGCIPVRLTS
jgi:hypothetical protein